jgi:SAM-dependent methyltransferase
VPDLFIPEHLRDPDDPNNRGTGGTPAQTQYLNRVLKANGYETEIRQPDGAPQVGAPEGEEEPHTKLMLKCEPAVLDVDKGEEAVQAVKPSTVDLPPIPLHDVRSKEMADKVLSEGRLRLNIGADRCQVSGFLNVDINPAVDPDFLTSADDLSMIDTGVCDEIYASHVLEHLDWKAGLVALKEWLRVLKPDGMLTVAVPDIEGVYMLYKHNGKWGDYNLPVDADYIQSSIFGSNLLADAIPEMRDFYCGPGMDHKAFYMRDMLVERVLQAGFVGVHEVTSCFLRGSGIGETMVQARKPKQGESSG